MKLFSCINNSNLTNFLIYYAYAKYFFFFFFFLLKIYNKVTTIWSLKPILTQIP